MSGFQNWFTQTCPTNGSKVMAKLLRKHGITFEPLVGQVWVNPFWNPPTEGFHLSYTTVKSENFETLASNGNPILEIAKNV